MNTFKNQCFLFICLLIFGHAAYALDVNNTMIQGALVIGQTAPENKIRFLKRNVKVNTDGFFVIGLHRDTEKQADIIEILPDGVERVHTFAVKQRKYKEQRISGVPKRTVDIPESELPRIREESKLIKATREVDSSRQDFLQAFQWPSRGVITGVYGSRRVYNGQPRRPHFGVDIAAPQGTPVHAPVSGKVLLVHNNMFFAGGTLVLDHGHGVSTTYIHLHKVLVKEGDSVERGQPVAEVGSTGRSTGPHLHWGMNWFDQRLDPQLLMDSLPEKL